MRLLLTTIILTMLAQPVWALTLGDCAGRHEPGSICEYRCRKVVISNQVLTASESWVQETGRAMYIEFEKENANTLADQIRIYEFFCKEQSPTGQPAEGLRATILERGTGPAGEESAVLAT